MKDDAVIDPISLPVEITFFNRWENCGGFDSNRVNPPRVYHSSAGRVIMSQKIARTAPKAGKPKANHRRKS
ncbi:hypothetical protein FB001_102169 [Ensifer sp. SEMIA 135]|nr:hypothetical protein FB001_102169 [Ensifer sp. SEMIA 135]